MSNGNAVQLAVQLETADLQIGTEELADICDSLNQSMGRDQANSWCKAMARVIWTRAEARNSSQSFCVR